MVCPHSLRASNGMEAAVAAGTTRLRAADRVNRCCSQENGCTSAVTLD